MVTELGTHEPEEELRENGQGSNCACQSGRLLQRRNWDPDGFHLIPSLLLIQEKGHVHGCEIFFPGPAWLHI